MDLLSNLNETNWQNTEPGQVQGLVEYTVLKNKMLEPGKFEYALRENKEDGELVMGILQDAQGKSNPLHSARQVEMKVVQGQIVAVNLDGDCVVRK